MRTTVRRVIGESQPRAFHGSLLWRILGEEAHGEEADFIPTGSDSAPEPPPTANTPSDSDFSSLADVQQHQADDEMARQGTSSALASVMAMWRSGAKYDTADYLLKSNFLYADFVRMVRMLPAEEAIELGTILDELAPPNPSGDEPTDLVSAVSGVPSEPPSHDARMPAPGEGQGAKVAKGGQGGGAPTSDIP